MVLSRREMLKMSASAGATVLWSGLPAFAQLPEARKKPIPSSGELIPTVGLGTRSFGVAATSEEAKLPLTEVLRLFVEMGGTLIDTAPAYRDSEATLGELAVNLGITHDVFWATKVGANGREAGIAQMDMSMSRLLTGPIDLMQVHNLRDYETQLATMREWKDAGRLRYIGITTSSLRAYDRFYEVMMSETLDFVQLNYSIGTRNAEERLLSAAADRGMAVMVNLPYERARLFEAVAGNELPEWAADFDCESWGQFFLKYILSHPAVTCVIPATTKPHHLRDNMGALYGRLPDEATRAHMVKHFEAIAS